MRSDWSKTHVLSEGLTLETSAFKSLYGGQFTLSIQLIKPNYIETCGLRLHTSTAIGLFGGDPVAVAFVVCLSSLFFFKTVESRFCELPRETKIIGLKNRVARKLGVKITAFVRGEETTFGSGYQRKSEKQCTNNILEPSASS